MTAWPEARIRRTIEALRQLEQAEFVPTGWKTRVMDGYLALEALLDERTGRAPQTKAAEAARDNPTGPRTATYRTGPTQ